MPTHHLLLDFLFHHKWRSLRSIPSSIFLLYGLPLKCPPCALQAPRLKHLPLSSLLVYSVLTPYHHASLSMTSVFCYFTFPSNHMPIPCLFTVCIYTTANPSTSHLPCDHFHFYHCWHSLLSPRHLTFAWWPIDLSCVVTMHLCTPHSNQINHFPINATLRVAGFRHNLAEG